MKTEQIWSPIEDKKIAENLDTSKIWMKAFKPEEVTPTMLAATSWWVYTIKFDGIKPIQVTKIKNVNNEASRKN